MGSGEAEASTAGTRLSWPVAVAYAVGNFSVGALPATIGSFLLYFWVQTDDSKSTAFLLLGAFSLVQMFGRIQDAVADPIVGYFSDKWNTKFGRRLPWIALGAPVLLGSFVALWYPPTNDPTSATNIGYLALMLGLFWWGFTLVVAPYLSLLPEICPDLPQRIRVSQIMGYFEVLGTLVGLAAAGEIIDGANLALFETLPEATRPKYGDFNAHGYQTMSLVVAGACAVSLLPVLAFVRETGAMDAKVVPFKFFESARTCLKNRPFFIYALSTAAFRLGFGLVVASIVFFVKTIMHQTEGVSGMLSAVTLIVSLLFFFPVDVLARKYGKKKVYLWGLLGFALTMPLLATIGHAPFFGHAFGTGIAGLLGAEGAEADLVRVSHTFFIFLLIGPTLAVMYVLPRPIMADVMDLDFSETGYRREAMYNGMEAVFTKTAAGLSGVVLYGLALADPSSSASGAEADVVLGVGALTAVGPFGGVLLLLAWFLMRRYPIER